MEIQKHSKYCEGNLLTSRPCRGCADENDADTIRVEFSSDETPSGLPEIFYLHPDCELDQTDYHQLALHVEECELCRKAQ